MDDTLATALKMMTVEKNRHVVVIKEPNDVAGILSGRDLAMVCDPVNNDAGPPEGHGSRP
ncbi:MAG: hypothetical protein O7E56_09040 [SAR324 cluster bacterium]|nr:hypothetical protein [SAR324 cluster bacterium]